MTETSKKKPLSPRRMRFCLEYIAADTPTDAAIAAGFSEKGAAQQANRLLKNADVVAEIARRQEAASKRADITENTVIDMLLEDRKGAREAKQFGPAVKADELIGKKFGMFVDKTLIGSASEHTDEEIAAGLAKATAGGNPMLARELFRNVLKGIPPGSFDGRPELSDNEVDALIEKAKT